MKDTLEQVVKIYNELNRTDEADKVKEKIGGLKV